MLHAVVVGATTAGALTLGSTSLARDAADQTDKAAVTESVATPTHMRAAHSLRPSIDPTSSATASDAGVHQRAVRPPAQLHTFTNPTRSSTFAHSPTVTSSPVRVRDGSPTQQRHHNLDYQGRHRTGKSSPPAGSSAVTGSTGGAASASQVPTATGAGGVGTAAGAVGVASGAHAGAGQGGVASAAAQGGGLVSGLLTGVGKAVGPTLQGLGL